MEAILQTLRGLEGVNGAVVADGGGRILAYQAHAVYDVTLLQQVSRAIVTAIDSVKLLHEDWESVTAQFSEGKLLVRNVSLQGRGKGADLTLALIADMRLNLSFAGVAIRVAVGKLRSLAESGALSAQPALGAPQPAAAAFSSPQPPVVAAPPPPSGAGPAAAPAYGFPRASVPEIATSGLSWSGGSQSTLSASNISSIDAASAAVLAGCTKALARSVGPIAKRYVKETVYRLWPERTFSKELTPMLANELERYLETPDDAVQFRKAISKLI